MTPKGDTCATSSRLSASVQATDTNLSCAGVVLVKPSDLSYGPGVWQGVVRAGCDGGAHLWFAVVCCCCVGSDRVAGVRGMQALDLMRDDGRLCLR